MLNNLINKIENRSRGVSLGPTFKSTQVEKVSFGQRGGLKSPLHQNSRGAEKRNSLRKKFDEQSYILRLKEKDHEIEALND